MAVKSTTIIDLDYYKQYAGIDSTDDDDRLVDLIDAASEQVERFLDRKIKTASYTEFYWPDGTQWVRLKQYPVSAVGRVASGVENAIRVKGTGSTVYEATVAVTASAVVLKLFDASGNTTSTLAFSDYTTLTAMNTQISATSGWTGTVMHTDGNWASADLIQTPAQHCLSPDEAIITVPSTAAVEYELDLENQDNRGILINLSGWPKYRLLVEYTAGYSDSDSTLPDIPEDIKEAVAELAKMTYEASSRDGTLSSETVGTYTWQAAVQKTSVQRQGVDLLASLLSHRRTPV